MLEKKYRFTISVSNISEYFYLVIVYRLFYSNTVPKLIEFYQSIQLSRCDYNILCPGFVLPSKKTQNLTVCKASKLLKQATAF